MKKTRFRCKKVVRRETGKTKNVPESDQTSLLINEEKHIGKIKYKKKRKSSNTFSTKTKKNTSKKVSPTTRCPVRGTRFLNLVAL